MDIILQNTSVKLKSLSLMHIVLGLWRGSLLDLLLSLFPWHLSISGVLPWLWCFFPIPHGFLLPLALSIPWAFSMVLCSASCLSELHLPSRLMDVLSWADSWVLSLALYSSWDSRPIFLTFIWTVSLGCNLPMPPLSLPGDILELNWRIEASNLIWIVSFLIDKWKS